MNTPEFIQQAMAKEIRYSLNQDGYNLRKSWGVYREYITAIEEYDIDLYRELQSEIRSFCDRRGLDKLMELDLK